MAAHMLSSWHAVNSVEIHDRLASYDDDGARVGDTPNCIATVKYPYASLEGREANARLMAAAPDMANELRQFAQTAEDVASFVNGYACDHAAALRTAALRARALLAQIDGGTR